jgi:hypothetical protein
MKESDRRSFLRKIFTLTASAGVAGLLLDRIPGKSVIQPVEAQSMTIDSNNTGTGTTSLSSPGSPALTATCTGSGAALQGTCTAGTGVFGATTGNTNTGTGVQGLASGAGGTALAGFAGDPGAIPIVAQGDTGQTANLQEWRNGSGTVGSVNASGAMLATQVGQSSPNVQYTAPGNPPSFTNSVASAYLADGLAIPFTPKLSGNVLVFAAVDLYNTSGAYTFGQIWYGTGGAPSFGATIPAGGVQVSPGRGNINASGSLFAFLTGLTIGTQYWFDLGHGINGGTGTHNNIAYTVVEI